MTGDLGSKFPPEEKKICDAFYNLIIFIYEYENKCSGTDYLRPEHPKEEENTPKKHLDTIHEIENSAYVDFSVYVMLN